MAGGAVATLSCLGLGVIQKSRRCDEVVDLPSVIED